MKHKIGYKKINTFRVGLLPGQAGGSPLLNGRTLFFFISLFVLLCNAVQAQKPKPSPSPTPSNQEEIGDYKITSSIELGVRGISVDGNDNKYRSDLNYEPGFRLFDSSFLMKAKNDKGKLFDNLVVSSTGFSADPDGFTRINVDKIGWYKSDAKIRRFTYFNSLSNLALNQHTSNTKRTLGDFDLTLLPENERIKFHLSYSLNRNSGAAATTYYYQLNEFPILSTVKFRSDEFRGGIDAKLAGFELSLTQGIQRFNDNTNYRIDFTQTGNTPFRSALETFQREVPFTGRTFYTRLSVHRLFAKRLDFTGRFVYSSSTSRFTLSEKITGKDFVGNTITLDQLNSSGDSKRPDGVGDVGLTFFATSKLKISNAFSVNSYRTTGGNILSDSLARATPLGTAIPTVFLNTLSHRLQSYRRFADTIEADYQFTKNYALHFGYRYADLRIVLDDFDRNFAQTSPVNPAPYEFNNRANTYFVGGKLRPFEKWTAYFDIERGEADYVFTRLNNFKFTNFRARNRITPTDNIALNFSVVTKDNNNPTQNFGVDVNNRIYTSSVDWSPNQKFSFSGGYTYQHLTSEAVILLPINSIQTQGVSRYFVRDRFVFVDAFVTLHPRVTLFAGYYFDKDNGQGSTVSSSPETIIGSYPLQFQFPEMRLAVKLGKRIDWNSGYKFYNYKEKFQTTQDYRAHLPYTSLRIYIGRER